MYKIGKVSNKGLYDEEQIKFHKIYVSSRDRTQDLLMTTDALLTVPTTHVLDTRHKMNLEHEFIKALNESD